ncbi:hypothetical protein OESDEN_01566 [Oesophagostomum dentatum]|uniref:Caspase family p20 domain-containing protein n=1 Tax=Oesophagostomum dentatum TaxID=61180 RepID=A0A0B1TLK8_OESDE|nr:hypothetical protein OESDEN_01566 [Oesophagostomum dentatum]
MYLNLPKLVTPHCDAETLATALQDLKYKTVTLADLTLAEMKFVIKEYKKLLGTGVYGLYLQLIEIPRVAHLASY